jgi:hypothetical protein
MLHLRSTSADVEGESHFEQTLALSAFSDARGSEEVIVRLVAADRHSLTMTLCSKRTTTHLGGGIVAHAPSSFIHPRASSVFLDIPFLS